MKKGSFLSNGEYAFILLTLWMYLFSGNFWISRGIFFNCFGRHYALVSKPIYEQGAKLLLCWRLSIRDILLLKITSEYFFVCFLRLPLKSCACFIHFYSGIPCYNFPTFHAWSLAIFINTWFISFKVNVIMNRKKTLNV